MVALYLNTLIFLQTKSIINKENNSYYSDTMSPVREIKEAKEITKRPGLKLLRYGPKLMLEELVRQAKRANQKKEPEKKI